MSCSGAVVGGWTDDLFECIHNGIRTELPAARINAPSAMSFCDPHHILLVPPLPFGSRCRVEPWALRRGGPGRPLLRSQTIMDTSIVTTPAPLPTTFLTLDEVCAILRVPKSTFYTKRSRDAWGPPATRIAGSLLFRASEFWVWVDAQPTEGPNRETAV